MNGDQAKKLIEVALPIREISAESVRYSRCGTGMFRRCTSGGPDGPWRLRGRWSSPRRSLVPDPDDPRCPAEFRTAVERLLKTQVPAGHKYHYDGRNKFIDEDPYRPYEGMPDTLRNRLLMFVAKWSPSLRRTKAASDIAQSNTPI